MRKILTIIIYSVFLFEGCKNKTIDTDMFVIDVSKDYPEKFVSFQEMGGELEYIPLETNDEVLMEATATPVYISDKKIIIMNPFIGDIFIFGRNGKIESHFNHKGQSGEEYNNLRHLVYDEKNKEFFVSDYKKILVYSEEGQYKRHFSFPETNFEKISNFDDETLLGYDEYDIYGNDYRTKPYLFVSKKDGSIVSELDINLPQRYSIKQKYDTENGKIVIRLGDFSNWHDGKDFVIADLSSDTIYKLTRDKRLIPLGTRVPSVSKNEMKTLLSVIIKTDKFMLLSANVADFEKVKKGIPLDALYLLYNFADNRITKSWFTNDDCSGCRYRFWDIEAPENTTALFLSSFRLIEQRELGNISGNLKPIAEKVDEEDNPVLMVVKFK
ncbi:MAG: 6-bladed beta-propeller [Prevotellaceae bacterium]|jgi:hypothetical protein|nr:6-bladed beta-propeller [Prevotellaceae bacterium]